MTRDIIIVTASWLAFVGALVAQSSQARDRDRSWSAPPEAAQKVNPLASQPDAVAGGAKLYKQRCATCHGDIGRGTSKAPDLTAPDVQAQSDGALFWKITTGNTHAGMPAFSFLPDPQRWQLVLHVRALGTAPTGATKSVGFRAGRSTVPLQRR